MDRKRGWIVGLTGISGRVFLAGAALGWALFGAGCAKKTAGDVERIQASGNFRVAIVDTDSPYTSLEGETPVGIEPDLAEYIGEMLGVKVQYQVCGKKEALAAVADGEADVALGCLNRSGNLASDYLVSTSYGKGYFYVITKTGDYALTIGALENSPVGVDRGLLLAVRVDGLEVNGQGRDAVLVALSPNPVSDGGGYQALIGADPVTR